ncbi:hypothetical protein C0Q44_19360 [Paenibacillus sp. PCH8]|nr:hypothetical protein C0Q44_19360 [Paenibacillus sp. PCH8]
MNTYRVLQTDMDFLVAAVTQVRVSVWHIFDNCEHIIDYGGPVEGYSESSIKIMGGRYFRKQYEFRAQKKEPNSGSFFLVLRLIKVSFEEIQTNDTLFEAEFKSIQRSKQESASGQ